MSQQETTKLHSKDEIVKKLQEIYGKKKGAKKENRIELYERTQI